MLRMDKLQQADPQNGHNTIRMITNFLLPGLIGVAWLSAALMSKRPKAESLGLVLTQFVLAVTICRILARALPRYLARYGPGLNFAVGTHMLIYYGLSNVVPALFPEMRNLTANSIPMSSVWAYSLATVAAVLLFLGLMGGFQLVSRLWPMPRQYFSGMTTRYPWLPPYRLAMIACVILLVFVVIGTIQYGVHFSAELVGSEAMAAELPFGQQLLYHGLFFYFPIAPILAATAFVQAVRRVQRRSACWLLVIACLTTFLVLIIWGRRSTAILAMILPLVLLVHAGTLDWRKILLPVAGLVVIVYGVVTFIRSSDFPALLSRTSDISQLTINDLASAIMTRTNNRSVIDRALDDVSYRTAGLEPGAALIQAQTEASLPLQKGQVIWAGLIQGLPLFLRPTFAIAERSKTAPVYLGVFKQGDYVTTFLHEFILDFGPYFLFFPAVLAGFGLALIDRALLGLGRRPALKALLILRLAFLLSIMSNGWSLGEMTLTFFKASIGYTAFFLVAGVVARISLNPKRQESYSLTKVA